MCQVQKSTVKFDHKINENKLPNYMHQFTILIMIDYSSKMNNIYKQQFPSPTTQIIFHQSLNEMENRNTSVPVH